MNIIIAVGALVDAGQIAAVDWFPGSSSVLETEAIPPAYRGSWAPDRRGCADTDGIQRIHVYPEGVDHYESGGRLERVTQAGQEGSIRLKLSYEGEGEFWDTIETWTLSPEEDRLTIGGSGSSNSEVLIRC